MYSLFWKDCKLKKRDGREGRLKRDIEKKGRGKGEGEGKEREREREELREGRVERRRGSESMLF